MTAKKKARGQLKRLGEDLLKLVEILRRPGPARSAEWWNSQSPRSIFKPPNPYEDGLSLFDPIVDGILSLNPNMLERPYIQKKLAFEFLMPHVTARGASGETAVASIVTQAIRIVEQLIQFETWSDVDVPITNLELEGEPVTLGGVTFLPLSEDELQKWRDQPVTWAPTKEPVKVCARVRVGGNVETGALGRAMSRVELVLTALRAFCAAFGYDGELWGVAMVGGPSGSRVTPMRIDGREHAGLISTKGRGGPALLELRRHVWSKLEEQQWVMLDNLILKRSPSDMEKKLLTGIRWLGESTRVDANDAKFVKLCIALESMIGGEPEDESLQVRGVTAMLAERAAFLVGKDRGDRDHTDKTVREYYGKRCAIVHRGKTDISLHDLDEFGELVRGLALKLLARLATPEQQLTDIRALETWVREQRYTLPLDAT